MIIFIGSSDRELTKISPDVLRKCFKELLRAHRSGTHLVVASRGVCSWALRHLQFDPEDMATLHRLRSNFAQTGGLLSQASVYVRIVIGEEVYDDRDNVFVVKLEQLLTHNTLDRVRLVAENIQTDCKIYGCMINESGSRAGLHLGGIELIHGGGDDLPQVVQNCIDERRMFVGMIDGDMKSPATPQSTKAKRCADIVSQAHVLGNVYALPCHEIENVIPTFLIERYIAKTKRPILRTLLDLDKRDTDRQHPYLRYHDFCQGLTSNILGAMPADDREWVNARLKSLQINLEKKHLRGIGKSLARIVKESGFNEDLRKYFDRIPLFMKEVLERVVWMFVANRPLIT